MEEPNFSSAAPSMGEQASEFLKEMMMDNIQRTQRRGFISRIDHKSHNTPGEVITLSDGTTYEVQWNGSWKKTKEGLKGKARRKFEKAMAEVNV